MSGKARTLTAGLIGLAVLAASAGRPGAAAKSPPPWPEWLLTAKPLDIGLNYSSGAPDRLRAFAGLGIHWLLGAGRSVAGWSTSMAADLAAYRALGFSTIAYSTPQSLFGDRYFEDEVGRTFMHLPDRAEILADLTRISGIWGARSHDHFALISDGLGSHQSPFFIRFYPPNSG